METFPALLVFCAGNSPGTGEFPSQRLVMRSFNVFFDLRQKTGSVNNREAGDLRRHGTHYDFTVMFYCGSKYEVQGIPSHGYMFRALLGFVVVRYMAPLLLT